jgi:hypothetical protein
MELSANVLSSARGFAFVGSVARLGQRWTIGDGSRLRWLGLRLPLAGAWLRERRLPIPPRRSFRELWPALERETRR